MTKSARVLRQKINQPDCLSATLSQSDSNLSQANPQFSLNIGENLNPLDGTTLVFANGRELTREICGGAES